MFQTHANEHVAAVERSLVARGRRPIQLLGELGVLGPHVLLAHATLLTPDEMLLLRDTGAAVAYNPVASAWKGNAVAPAGMMAALGIRFGLGTDGTRADAFRLLDMAEASQRIDVRAGRRAISPPAAAGCGSSTPPRRVRRRSAWAASPARWHLGSRRTSCCWTWTCRRCTPSWDLPWELVRLAGPGPDRGELRRRPAAAVARLAGRLGRPGADAGGRGARRRRRSRARRSTASTRHPRQHRERPG